MSGSREGPLQNSIPSGASVYVINPVIKRGLISRIKLSKIIGRHIDIIKPDIVFLPGNYHFILSAGIKHSSTKPFIVGKISNPIYLSSNYGFFVRFINNAFIRYATRNIDWVVAMSNGLKRDFETITKRDTVTSIYDPKCFASKNKFYHKYIKNKSDRVVLIAAGRLVSQKNFTLAIKAMAHLQKTHDVHLTILGDGPDRRSLEKLIDKCKLKDCIDMPGRVPDITPMLLNADALLITSTYEGGPAVAVEALDVGTPVVATDCSHFLRELITEIKYGSICSGKNHIEYAENIIKVVEFNRNNNSQKPSKGLRFGDNSASDYLKLFDFLIESESIFEPTIFKKGWRRSTQ